MSTTLVFQLHLCPPTVYSPCSSQSDPLKMKTNNTILLLTTLYWLRIRPMRSCIYEHWLPNLLHFSPVFPLLISLQPHGNLCCSSTMPSTLLLEGLCSYFLYLKHYPNRILWLEPSLHLGVCSKVTFSESMSQNPPI